MASSIYMSFGGFVSDGSGNVTSTGTVTAATVNSTSAYQASGVAGIATFGPSAVASITIKQGIVTAAS